MSLLNLTNGVLPIIVIGQINTNEVDGIAGGNLNIGTSGTGDVNIGATGNHVNILGELDTTSIKSTFINRKDANNLNIGTQQQGAIILGAPGATGPLVLISSDQTVISGNAIIASVTTTSVDTPASNPLLLGTVHSSSIQMGATGHNTINYGPLLTNIIDTYGATGENGLTIGANMAGSIVINGPTSPSPVRMYVGLLTDAIDHTDAVPGTLFIASNPTVTTETRIGSGTRVLRLFGSALQFPGTTPYIINTSYAEQQTTVAFTTAVAAPNACTVVYSKFGSWVTLQLKQIIADPVATANQPIVLDITLPVEIAPTSQVSQSCRVVGNATGNVGQIIVTPAGVIQVGNVDSFPFVSGQTCGFRTICIQYNQVF